jgi:hypothetical protein
LQQINYVSKAKQLMKSAVRTTALVVMPLATAVNMLALPSYTTLPTNPVTCETSGAGGSNPCSGGAAQLTEYNNIMGVKLYTSGPVIFDSMSGGTSVLKLIISSGSLAGPGLASGVGIPLSYSFELGLVPGPPTDSLLAFFVGTGNIGDWWLNYTLSRDDIHSTIGTASASGSGAGSWSGTASMTTLGELPMGVPVGLNAQLFVQWTTNSYQDSLSMNVPQNSFDFNAVPDEAGVPEPGSMGLLASGLALLGWRVCRRRRA